MQFCDSCIPLSPFSSDYDDDHIDESGMVYDAHGA